jgi:hypothetical protein
MAQYIQTDRILFFRSSVPVQFSLFLTPSTLTHKLTNVVKCTNTSTPWCRVLENLIVAQKVKTFPTFYGSRMFITVHIRTIFETLIITQLAKISLPFPEPESSLPCSKDPTTNLCPCQMNPVRILIPSNIKTISMTLISKLRADRPMIFWRQLWIPYLTYKCYMIRLSHPNCHWGA